MKKKFGHYEVVSELGRGGMGVVYKAWEPSLNRHVAIKVLGDHLLGDEALIERFTREAKAMAAINHPNVIQVYFIGMEEKQPYFAMEFIEGISLDEMLKGNKSLSLGHAKEIIRQACLGLSIAHSAGLVHRDIKPANLMVCADGTIKVVDFGIAQTREYGDKLTNTGEFVGTPGYLSPEVCTGKDVDARSDIFALGIVFYEMLAGKVPFENESPLGLMLEVVQANIPDIREINKKVDRKTSYVLQKMIAKNPEERFQNCEDIVSQLGNTSIPLSITEIQKHTVAVNPAQVKARISEQITLPSGAAVTENQLVPIEKKKGSKKWLAAAMVLVVAGATALGVHQGYIPLPEAFKSGSDLTTASTSTPTTASTEPLQASAANGSTPPPQNTATDGSAMMSGLSGFFSSEDDDEEQSSDAEDNAVMAQVDGSGVQLQVNDQTLKAGAGEVNDSSMASLSHPNLGKVHLGEENADKAGLDKIDLTDASINKPSQTKSVQTVPSNQASQLQQHGQPQIENTVAHVNTKVVKDSRPKVRILDKGVAVVVFGDPAVANPIEKILESELKNKKVKVLNEQFIPGMSKMLREGADMATMREAIMNYGGSALVIANVNFIGEQTLEYYGRSSQLINAQLDIDSYDLKSGDSIGSGYGAKLSYTSLNATEQAEEALMGFIDAFSGDMAKL